MKLVATSARQSARSRRVCAMFGIRVAEEARDPAREERVVGAAREIDCLLGRGGVALITGPSGGGKTCLLRAVERVVRGRGEVCVRAGVGMDAADRLRPIVDLFGCPSQTALRWLSRVGLAEPALFPLCAAELSEGQRARLGIGLAMCRVELWDDGDHGDQGVRGGTVLIDEFGSSLDETSALTLAASLSRRAARSGVRVVCAGVRGDIAAALRARVVALVKLSGEIEVMARGARGGRNDAERAA